MKTEYDFSNAVKNPYINMLTDPKGHDSINSFDDNSQETPLSNDKSDSTQT